MTACNRLVLLALIAKHRCLNAHPRGTEDGNAQDCEKELAMLSTTQNCWTHIMMSEVA